jgi:Zn-finger nucleic acid-binding protein
MKCVKCNNVDLKPASLEQGLVCQQCEACEGSWVRMQDYLQWLDHIPDEVNLAVAKEELDVEDSSAVLICPQCNQIMGKFRVSAEMEHRMDQCANCGGFWLDKGEWKYLQRFNLHTRINTIFTDSWQRKIREDTFKRNAEKRYLTKFGVVTYQQVKELKDYLIGNPFKNRVVAYLMNPDPKVPNHAKPLNQSYCPKCSKLMARYRLLSDSDIYLEQCDACEGIWINAEQWTDILRKDVDIGDVFTNHDKRGGKNKVPYSEQYFEAMFGKELYRKVKLFKQTLEKHESKLELISYLSKED